MRRDKRQTGVARSKFIDRIKCSSQMQLDHKENMNLNDIRQSGYKLPRSKSNTRYDHSLQRKQPIKITKDALNCSHEQNASEMTLKNTLKQYATEVPTGNNTIKLDTFHNGSFTDDKEGTSQRSYQQCSGMFNQVQLREEDQILDTIKAMWEGTVKIKDKSGYKEEMSRIQAILKEVIIVMAKPKFNSIQDSSTLSLKVPQIRFSPFQNLQSFKESKACSNHSSMNYYPSHTQRNNEAKYHLESEAEDELEFKKIMYILEEKSRMTRNALEYSTSDCNEGRQLKEISDILNIKTSCYSSSFDSSSRDPSGHTVCEYQKVNNSRSNERVFLKNIVKKAKSSISNVEQAQKMNFEKKSRSDVSCYEDEQYNNQTISQQGTEEQESAERQPELSFSQEGQPQDIKYMANRARNDHIKIETMQTLEDQSDSKRIVLNQIISMLNNKYHKNIKLEPRKF